MAFVLTAIKAYGEFIDEAITSQALQTVKLSFTRTTSGDGTINLSKRASLSSGDFWDDVDATALGVTALALWEDVITKAEGLASLPILTQTISSQSYLAIPTPTNYDNIGGDADVAVARNYTECQVTFKGSSVSLVDIDLDVFDAASGTTEIACTLLVKFVLKAGEKPVHYIP